MPMHYGHGGKKKPTASKPAGKKMSPKQKALAKKGSGPKNKIDSTDFAALRNRKMRMG